MKKYNKQQKENENGEYNLEKRTFIFKNVEGTKYNKKAVHETGCTRGCWQPRLKKSSQPQFASQNQIGALHFPQLSWLEFSII